MNKSSSYGPVVGTDVDNVISKRSCSSINLNEFCKRKAVMQSQFNIELCQPQIYFRLNLQPQQ